MAHIDICSVFKTEEYFNIIEEHRHAFADVLRLPSAEHLVFSQPAESMLQSISGCILSLNDWALNDPELIATCLDIQVAQGVGVVLTPTSNATGTGLESEGYIGAQKTLCENVCREIRKIHPRFLVGEVGVCLPEAIRDNALLDINSDARKMLSMHDVSHIVSKHFSVEDLRKHKIEAYNLARLLYEQEVSGIYLKASSVCELPIALEVQELLNQDLPGIVSVDLKDPKMFLVMESILRETIETMQNGTLGLSFSSFEEYQCVSSIVQDIQKRSEKKILVEFYEVNGNEAYIESCAEFLKNHDVRLLRLGAGTSNTVFSQLEMYFK